MRKTKKRIKKSKPRLKTTIDSAVEEHIVKLIKKSQSKKEIKKSIDAVVKKENSAVLQEHIKNNPRLSEKAKNSLGWLAGVITSPLKKVGGAIAKDANKSTGNFGKGIAKALGTKIF